MSTSTSSSSTADGSTVFATIIVPSPTLQIDDQNRLREAPDLLKKVLSLAKELPLLWPGQGVNCDRILGTEGAYVIEARGCAGLFDGDEVIRAVLTRYKQDLEILRLNAEQANPKTAQACGVPLGNQKVMRALEALAHAGCGAEIVPAGERSPSCVLPNPGLKVLATLDTGTSKGGNPIKVNGAVTGIFWDDKGSHGVLVGPHGRYVVAGLDRLRALDYCRGDFHVTGNAEWIDEQWVITRDAILARTGQLDL